MSTEQAIIAAAIPLLGEDPLTTARIAEAAGIDESEILAVFPGVDAVIRQWRDCSNARKACARCSCPARSLDA